MPKQSTEHAQSADKPATTNERAPQPEQDIDLQQRISFVAGLFQGNLTGRTLLESLGEGIVVIDRTGVIVLVNRRVEEMFGYPKEEVIGQSLNVFLPEQSFTAHARHIHQYFKKPLVRRMGQGIDLMGKRKDGVEFPVEVSLSHLETQAGPVGLAFVIDITLRKEAENLLKQRNEELDAFASTVAHDLNASLSNIIGFSDVLADIHETLPPEELRKYLNILMQSGRKMSNIINELLLFARMKKDDVPLHMVDMTPVVAEALGRLSHEVTEFQAEIIQPDSFPEAVGYTPWVEEVWFNLISNGLKYGGTPPLLELGSTIQDDGRVLFWVKDNGHGLTAEQREEILTSSSRTSLPQAKGHGLGLSIVKRMVDKLNGELVIESEVGRGSLFGFTLPISET